MKAPVIAWVIASMALLSACTPEEPRPRLIYILSIDSLRFDAIHKWIDEKPIMPNLAAFASDHIEFTNAYSHSSFTKISVASLFTGMWPQRTGVRNCRIRIHPTGVELCADLSRKHFTLSEGLREAGYTTITSEFTAHVNRDSDLLQGFDLVGHVIPTEISVSERTFIYNHIIGAHAPYAPDPTTLQRFAKSQVEADIDPASANWYRQPLDGTQAAKLRHHYWSEVYEADTYFGQFRSGLEAQGLWDDALIIITADHGEELLEHGKFGHSVQLFEEVIRVPLVIKFPYRSPAAQFHGVQVDDLTRHVDVLPTIAAIAGFNLPQSVDGTDIAQVLKNPNLAPEATIAFTSVPRDYQGGTVNFELDAIRLGELKLISGYLAEDSQNPGVVDFSRGDPFDALFDLGADPAERINLAKRQPDLFNEVHRQLESLLEASGEETDRQRTDRERRLRGLGYIQ